MGELVLSPLPHEHQRTEVRAGSDLNFFTWAFHEPSRAMPLSFVQSVVIQVSLPSVYYGIQREADSRRPFCQFTRRPVAHPATAARGSSPQETD